MPLLITLRNEENIADGTRIVAVIKADGYGHGAEAISRLIEDYEYIWGFATATAEEAIQLKDAGIEKPVLILGLVFEEYFQELIRKDVRLTVCEYNVAKILSDEAVRQGRQVHIHIALDTGMSRIGFADKPESVEEIKRSPHFQMLRLKVCLHTSRGQMRRIKLRQ